jgi:hypothetical protein
LKAGQRAQAVPDELEPDEPIPECIKSMVRSLVTEFEVARSR